MFATQTLDKNFDTILVEAFIQIHIITYTLLPSSIQKPNYIKYSAFE
jgi:hypothetical protein